MIIYRYNFAQLWSAVNINKLYSVVYLYKILLITVHTICVGTHHDGLVSNLCFENDIKPYDKKPLWLFVVLRYKNSPTYSVPSYCTYYFTYYYLLDAICWLH